MTTKVGKKESRKVKKTRLPDTYKGRNLKGSRIRKAKGRVSKGSRTWIESFYFDSSEAKIRQPPWDYEALVEIGKTSWTQRMIYRAIKQEAFRPELKIQGKFFKKCQTCGKEYDKVQPTCTALVNNQVCGGALRDPDQGQRKILEELLRHPNSDYGWRAILSSSLFFDVNCGGFWWSIAYHEIPLQAGGKARVPGAIYVEDPRYMRFIADGQGNIGGDEYFCPNCSTKDIAARADDFEPGEEAVCPKCSGPLVQTCYVQEIEGKVTARFGRDEIIFNSSDQVLPELYPCPRPVALWDLLLTLGAMDDRQREVYTQGGVENLVNFEEYSNKEEIETLRKQIDDETKKHFLIDPVTRQPVASLQRRNFYFASKGKVDSIPLGIDPAKMQSLETWKAYREANASVYGVTPIFVSIVESGKTGNNPRMQIDVQNRTTEEVHSQFEDALDVVVAKWQVTEWNLRFERPDPRDDLRDQRVQLMRAQTALTYMTAGFSVKIDDNGDLQVSGSSSLTQPSTPESEGQESQGDETLQLPGRSEPPLPGEDAGAEEEVSFQTENTRLGIWPLSRILRLARKLRKKEAGKK